MEDALSRLAQLEEEKKHWDFMEETRRQEKEATLKPVTPSKIPVGSFRVEEEKAITRALNGQADSNRAASPPPPSRIPKFFKASNYMKVKVGIQLKLGAKVETVDILINFQEKMEKAANEKYEAHWRRWTKIIDMARVCTPVGITSTPAGPGHNTINEAHSYHTYK